MEDTKIIAMFWERNEQAVKETDTAYGRKLFVLSNNILNNREDAEESVSDTYMEAWKTIPPKRPKYFYAFLASICRNLSLNRLDWRMAAKRNAEVVTLTQEFVRMVCWSMWRPGMPVALAWKRMDTSLSGAMDLRKKFWISWSTIRQRPAGRLTGGTRSRSLKRKPIVSWKNIPALTRACARLRNCLADHRIFQKQKERASALSFL